MVLPYALTMIGSRRLAEARPVATPRTPCATPPRRRPCGAGDPSAERLPASLSSRVGSAFSVDDRIPSTSPQNIGEPAIVENGEDKDRDVVLACQRNRRGVHYAQIAREDIEIIEAVETLGARYMLGVGVIDAIDFGCLQQRIATHLGRAQRRCRIGGKKRVAGSGGKNDNPPLLQVAQRPATDVG